MDRMNSLRERVSIGIITALPEEYIAMKLMLEDPIIPYTAEGTGAGRRYLLSEVRSQEAGVHVVVLAMLTETGNNNASIRATQLLMHFPKVNHIIMCGIAGGIPSFDKPDEHTRLGDIVVSDRGGVIQYDFIKDTPTEEEKTEQRFPPRPPDAELLEAVKILQAQSLTNLRPWEKFLSRGAGMEGGDRPSDDLNAEGKPIEHPHDSKRTTGLPRLFLGPIASANRLIKDENYRDVIKKKYHVKAFEMEASGIADATWMSGRAGYLIIRGICDYCDPAKGDLWHGYSAVAAAAYVRALIESMPVDGPIDGNIITESPIIQDEKELSVINAGLELRSIQSYQKDINKLKQHSITNFELLSHLAKISVGPDSIKIIRHCSTALMQAVENGPILIVGEPGSGKSGVLHDLAEILNIQGRDYVYLAVDRIAANSISEFQTEMGLEHNFAKVLDNWPGLQPAFFIIDALDAARGEKADIMIRDLIRQVIQSCKRWKVVASIRKFDLRQGVEIRKLFTGPPPSEFQDAEFKSIRHLNVPSLSDDEFNQIATQSTELHELISSAPEQLNDLLRVPFNLRLIAELLGNGIPTRILTPITTQLELLQQYWTYRVIRSDGQGDDREHVLRIVCKKMIEARELRADRSTVASEPVYGVHLSDLLSNQVLIEWQASPDAPPDHYILAFSHHVLFDYAASVLLLQGTFETVIRRFAEDHELSVIIRPSIILRFRHLWAIETNHQQFWNLALRIIREERIPEICKLIGPSVAAELTKTMSDLELLCAALSDNNPVEQEGAVQALRHLFGALLANASNEKLLSGPGAGPWCMLLECISQNLQPHSSRSVDQRLAYTICPLLIIICEHPEVMTPDQQIAAGNISRRLLEFAWSQSQREERLVINSLKCVCRTFNSDPQASTELIRRCLEQQHLSQYGYLEMPWLATEIKWLIPIAPELVREIYATAFSYQETSEESTSFGFSSILPMSSNRAQDYKMALYSLAESYHLLLEQSYINGIQALITVIEAYIKLRYGDKEIELYEEAFDFNGRLAHLYTDHSTIWGESDVYQYDEPIKMLNALQRHLESLAQDPEKVDRLHEIILHLIEKNRLAVIWRRVLKVATLYPDTLGKEILPFAKAIPILTAFDTSALAGEFIKVIFPSLDHCERELIEHTILKLPEAFPAERREAGEHIRNRLLGCLTETNFITEEAQLLLEQLRTNNTVPPNEDLMHIESFYEPYEEEDYLREQGVPIEAETNLRIYELVQPIDEFAKKYLNSAPTLQDVSVILNSLQELYEALSQADADGVHPIKKDRGWGHLSSAAARIARIDKLASDELPGSFIMTILLEASSHTEPVHNPEYDAQFDKDLGWEDLMPRTEAAGGLIILAHNPCFAIPGVLNVIEKLSNDAVPAVRYQIARNLNTLYHTATDLMWRIIERFTDQESNRGVLLGLLNGPLQKRATADPDRVAALAKTIFERIREGPGASAVREFCIAIFTGLYIWHDQILSKEITTEIASNPATYPRESRHLLIQIRNPLTNGPIHPPDPVQDAIRQRAMSLLELLLHSAGDELHRMQRRFSNVSSNEWPSQELERARSLATLIDSMGTEVYFASGAYDSKRQGQTEGSSPKNRQKAERFYHEAGTIINILADMGLPSVTHHLLETLEFFIPTDPLGVFLSIGRIIKAGQSGGYQFEFLAADLIVRLVERYLAEYRAVLRDDEDAGSSLIEILDIFVKAGWPSARKLTYCLEEIFR